MFSTDSTEIFISKLRSAGFNYNLPSFSVNLTVRGLSNKHCLLTFFIISGTIEYLQSDPATLPRIGVITAAGLGGALLGFRGMTPFLQFPCPE